MVQTGIDQEMMNKQLALEIEAQELGLAKYDMDRNKAYRAMDPTSLKPENYIMRTAIPKVAEKIKEFLQPSRGAQRMQKVKTFLRQLDPYDVAFITVRDMIHQIARRPETLSSVAFNLGQAVLAHLDYQRFKKAEPNLVRFLNDKQKSKHLGHKHKVLTIARHRMNVEDTEATPTEKLFLGQKLIELTISATGLFHLDKFYKTGAVEWHYRVAPTKGLMDFLEESHTSLRAMSHFYMPTVVPPLEWTGMRDGGYYSQVGPFKIPLVKTWKKDQIQIAEGSDLTKLFKVVNTLQNTPWRVNKFIFETMTTLFESGLGGIPETIKEKILPPTPWGSDDEFLFHKANNPDGVKEWKREAAKAHDAWARDASKRVAFLSKLWMARKFSEFDRFYFVWIADWRGRLYPLSSPFMNPQSDDLGKSLIEFADGKRLGERGVWWLAIYGASEFGFDKAPLKDRYLWVKEHEGYILECAEDPAANLWWTEADAPFKFLAFCKEWAGVCRLGVDFESHLPIGLDGSCNGPQHLSTMMLDEVGCKATNIESGEKPNDLYAQVAGEVNTIIAHDLEAKEIEGLAENVEPWVGKVGRSITKRNCMTMAYSATAYGFREQLLEELRKLDGKQEGSFLGVKNNWGPCSYLAMTNRRAISKVLVKAVEAMDWLQSVASVVSKDADNFITWTTPIGLKVGHIYRKTKTKRVETYWGETKIHLALQEETSKVNPVGVRNGISPNLVHSLDASHLSATVLKCASVGMQHFSMVHDSFGCHATDIDTMNTLLREAFIEQYSVNQLESFRAQVVAQVRPAVAEKIPACPKQGSFDLTKVRDSKYFFCC
jgi:DNA-directed RNA polymerase, mitochondrial